MNKLVYLFELDSVRNSDDQMNVAFNALKRELLVNGNIVVITFNQLIDSRFFLSLLYDVELSHYVLDLFKIGAIRISQFGKYRTPSQYLINQGLNSNEEFIFSGLPIKSNQKSLIALAKRSLIYSDLSEINEYIDGKRNEEELNALFRFFDGKEIKESEIEDNKTKIKTLKDLRAVLRLVLQLSDMQNIYNQPKRIKNNERRISLLDYYDCVKEFKDIDIVYWGDAINILNKIFCTNKTNKRSTIFKLLKKEYDDYKDDNLFDKYALAEAIIDLCYNYTCEDSISNISRHYDVNELYDNKECITFKNDFLLRLKQHYIDNNNRKSHFLVSECNNAKPYNFSLFNKFTLKRTSNLVNHSSVYKNLNITKIYSYEYDLHNQQRKCYWKYFCSAGTGVLLVSFYFISSIILFNYLDDCLNYLGVYVVEFLYSILKFVKITKNDLIIFLQTITITIVAETVSILLDVLFSKLGKNLPSFKDCLSRSADFFYVILGHKKVYYNESNNDLSVKDLDDTYNIDYVSKGIELYNKYKEERKGLFKETNVLPLYDSNNNAAKLTKIEELTGKQFGITHSSGFHTMIVDPVTNIKTVDEKNVFAYERLASNSMMNGVVIIPIINKNGKDYFVLLKQYRHAIREIQLAFPRGFGEDGLNIKENAKKELTEEIGAILENDLSSIEVIGEITTDSGSMCDRVDISIARIKSFDVNSKKERIISIEERTAEELKEMIVDKKINDSFTIQAFAFWYLRNSD